MLGYILRHHPSWAKLIEVGRTLGKPLVMVHEPGFESRETHRLLPGLRALFDAVRAG